jgi:hypothetical protein
MKKIMLKTNVVCLVAFATILLLGSCNSRPFISEEIKTKARRGATVAVLPYSIVFSGKMPENMTQEAIIARENKERLAFQKSLFDQISSRTRNTNLRLQSVNTTNARLKELSVDVHKIENYKPEVLATKLGVDMVVVPHLNKYRIMSDETSALVTGATVAIGIMTGTGFYVSPKTNEVQAGFAIVEAESGYLLWNIERKNSADWSRPVEDALDRLHWRMTKKLRRLD